MVNLYLAEGFEEIEALGTLDLIRRAGIEAYCISATDNLMVKGAHGITVKCDFTAENVKDSKPEMIILPGGNPGTANLEKSPFVNEALKSAYSEKRYISAICAAPSILGKMNMLSGKEATCYPGYEKFFGKRSDKKAVLDGYIITSAGPGTFDSFAAEIIAVLKGKNIAEKVLSDALFNSDSKIY